MTKKAKRINRQIRKIYHTTGGVTLEGDPITFRQFKNRVMARAKSEGITIRKAALKERNTESFVSAAQRSRYNLTEKIREEFPEQFKQLTEINRGVRDSKGRFTKLYNNLVWDKQRKGYVITDRYEQEYLIDVSNSPKTIGITPIVTAVS